MSNPSHPLKMTFTRSFVSSFFAIVSWVLLLLRCGFPTGALGTILSGRHCRKTTKRARGDGPRGNTTARPAGVVPDGGDFRGQVGRSGQRTGMDTRQRTYVVHIKDTSVRMKKKKKKCVGLVCRPHGRSDEGSCNEPILAEGAEPGWLSPSAKRMRNQRVGTDVKGRGGMDMRAQRRIWTESRKRPGKTLKRKMARTGPGRRGNEWRFPERVPTFFSSVG